MIVKNEEKNLRRLFASLYKWIDYYVISDTGSTDNTIKLIQELGAFYQIKGEVEEHAWVDFSHNRNLSIQAAIKSRVKGNNQCDWVMIIDADEELVVSDIDWKKRLMPGFTYNVFVKANGIATKKIFLIWLPDQQWEWKGTIHNYLVNKNINHQKLFIKELSIKYNQSEGSKSHRFKDSLDKGQYDIEQLLEELASEELNINNVHRYFQLAYGYRQIKDYNEAIKYFKRISKFEQASIDFRYTSSVLVAKYLLLLKSHDDEIEFFLNEAIRLDKERKEAYYYLALYRRKQDNLIMALATLEKANLISFSGKEFIYMEEDIYLWRIKYELAFVYFLLHKYAESSAMIRELKTEGYLPLIEMGFLDSLLHKMNL